MQKRIVRTGNASINTAPHYTIKRIVNTGERQFGFGFDDLGNEVYIPASVIKRYALTEFDAGAGFRARCIPPDPANHKSQPQVMLPLVFDDGTEEIEIDDEPIAPPPAPPKDDAHLHRILKDLDELIENIQASLNETAEDLQTAKRLHNDLDAYIKGELE